jgi:hypothetical protein
VSQGRVPLSEPKVRKILDTTSASTLRPLARSIAEIERWCRISGIAFHQDAIEVLGFGNRCRSAGVYPVVACTSTKSQGLTSASNPKLITHLADFSVQEVNFEHVF